MKFMLLCYDDESVWQKLGDAALHAAIDEAVELTHELHAKGQYILSSPLESVSKAKSVRVRDGKALVTDGPFAETREQLGGFHLIEAKDQHEALAIAARHPGARYGTVEVRPIMEIEGLPQTQ
jgi:hypothetical protein